MDCPWKHLNSVTKFSSEVQQSTRRWRLLFQMPASWRVWLFSEAFKQSTRDSAAKANLFHTPVDSLDCASEPRWQFHDGSEGVAPCDWRRQVRDKDTFQNIKDFILCDLGKPEVWTGVRNQGTQLPGQNLMPQKSQPSSSLLQSTNLDWLFLLTLTRYQEISIFTNAPGSHLYQGLLAEEKERWRLTVQPCSLPGDNQKSVPLHPHRTYLGIISQNGFVEFLYSVGMHLHAVGNQLDKVGHSIITNVAPCLEWVEKSDVITP